MATVSIGASPSSAFLPSPPRHGRHHSAFEHANTRTRISSQGSTQLYSSPPTGIGVGIDLGTTYSAVAVLVDGIPTILSIDQNGRTIPSVVGWNATTDEYILGRTAIEDEARNPLGTYRNVKRILGTGGTAANENLKLVPNAVAASIQKSKKKKTKPLSLTKQVQEAETNPALLLSPPTADGSRSTFSPEVISAQIVRALVQTAEQYTQQTVTRAVVGVPAYFHDAQRDATIRACQLAGVEKVKLLREPEAAALAYGLGKEQVGKGDEDELVLVFDLGGGTFDVSILVVGGGLTEVISTSGNVALGGSDFDQRIAEHLATVLKEHEGKKNILSQGGEAADAMIRASEAIRIYLSNNRKAYLALPVDAKDWAHLVNAKDVLVGPFEKEVPEEGLSNSTHVLYELTRKTMEGLCREEFQALLRPLREVAIMAGALLPGDARPGVVEAALELEEELERAMRESNGAPISFDDFYKETEGKDLATTELIETEDVDSDMLLELRELDLREQKRAQQKGRKRARNVAKQERKFRQEKRKIDTETDAKVIDGISGRPISQVVLVGGATRMPAIGRILAAMTGVVPQRTVNPDEAVALGCAVQVGVLDGNEDLNGLTVLTPMQAAIMRAVAEKEGLLGGDDDFDESEFETAEYF